MTTIKDQIFKLIDALKAQQARVIDENQLKALGFVDVARKLTAAFNQYNNLPAKSVSWAEIRPLLGQLDIIQSEIGAITAKLDRIDADLLAEVAKKDPASRWHHSATALQNKSLFSTKSPSSSDDSPSPQREVRYRPSGIAE